MRLFAVSKIDLAFLATEPVVALQAFTQILNGEALTST